MSTFNGPLAATRALSGMADEIGDPVILLIENSSLEGDERELLIKNIETVLVDVFMGDTVNALRQYTFDQWREKKALL